MTGIQILDLVISIHAPHARSDTISVMFSTKWACHFNPRSSCEERRRVEEADAVLRHFNPRSSCEERLASLSGLPWSFHDFNPRSSCEERLAARHIACLPRLNFNPRSSCEDRLFDVTTDYLLGRTFQSTLLMRGATWRSRGRLWPAPHFNPRSSCEERLYSFIVSDCCGKISIHAPHARSD